MSHRWTHTKLGELLHPVERAEAVDGSREYRLLGVRWYGDGFFVKDKKFGHEIKAQKVYRVCKGDFAYNRLFAWKGSFAVADSDVDGCYVSNEFPCFEPVDGRIDAVFLKWWFRRESAWLQALGLSSGATPTSRNRLKEQHFLGMEIPLPPLTEQRRIVARIEELGTQINEACTLHHQAAEEAEALLASYRRETFGEMPQADWISLSDYVASIQNGKSPATDGRPASADEWGVLKVGAVSFGIFDEQENKALPISFVPPPSLEVRRGDFIMSRANTRELVGACALVRETRPKLMLSDKTFRFVFREPRNVLPEYMEQVLKSPPLRDQIERGATGTSPTMKNISKDKVLALRLPPFAFPEQRRIVAELDALQAEVDALKRLQAETAAELDALFPAILDCAFRGEL